MIASGELEPGDHLRQDDLAQRLGTTRVPIREAFKALTADGVLVHRRNQGHFVARLTSKELRQLYWLRDTLEDEVARTARWPESNVLCNLRALNDQFGSHGHSGALNLMHQVDSVLHFTLWSLSPLQVIVAELSRNQRLREPYRTLVPYNTEMVDRSVADHKAIIDALQRHDRAAYEELLAAHRQISYDFLHRLTMRDEQHQAPRSEDAAPRSA